MSLLEDLQNPEDPKRRANAAVALADGAGPEALPLLVAALEDDEAQVRLSAAFALGELKVESALEPLVEATGDPDSRVRTEAGLAVGKLGLPEGVPALIELLEDPFPVARREAAVSLGVMADRRALGPLARRLGDTDREVRVEAALALAHMKDPRAYDELVSAAGHGDHRTDAIEGLVMLGDARALSVLEGIQKRWWVSAIERLQAAVARVRLGDHTAGGFVLEQLTSRRVQVRGYALEMLAELKLDEAFDVLVKTLTLKGDYHRDTAARALGKLGDERAVEPLLEVLGEHHEPELVADACEALGRLGARGALAALGELAAREDLHEDIRSAAAAAMLAIEENTAAS